MLTLVVFKSRATFNYASRDTHLYQLAICLHYCTYSSSYMTVQQIKVKGAKKVVPCPCPNCSPHYRHLITNWVNRQEEILR